jgi:D-alanyl-D-alanine carboxypeptidase
MKSILLSFLLISLVSCATNRKITPQYAKLEKYLDTVTKNKKGLGSVAILDKGELVYQKHFSFQDEEANPEYKIGSITKTYTGVIILRLVEEGKLTLKTKLSKFYKNIDGAKRINIEHLLRHRSGLPNMTSQKDYLSYYEKPISESQQIKRFSKYKLEFKPGKKYAYSNTGYVLLSYIAERASGLTYSQLLEKYITKPLGLTNTYVYTQSKRRNSEVYSYEKAGEWIKSSHTHESVPTGAGAIVSTPAEVAIFLRSLMTGKIINQKNLKKMKKLTQGYGLGITTFPYNKKRAYGHTGGIDGFRSIAGYIEEDDVTFVQLTNGMATSFNDISIAMLASYYKDSFDIPVFAKSLKLSENILKKYSGTYSGKSFPLKITFYSKNGTLFGKASGPGQGEIPFDAISKNDFAYMRASIKLKFEDEGETLIFTQGKTFKLRKE